MDRLQIPNNIYHRNQEEGLAQVNYATGKPPSSTQYTLSIPANLCDDPSDLLAMTEEEDDQS